jgi:hypothetical protein
MLQTQSYNDVLNMACMLPLREKKQLIRDIQVNVLLEDQAPCQFSTDEMRSILAEAAQEAREGNGTTHADFKREAASWL